VTKDDKNQKRSQNAKSVLREQASWLCYFTPNIDSCCPSLHSQTSTLPPPPCLNIWMKHCYVFYVMRTATQRTNI